jgi:hypothetical protein
MLYTMCMHMDMQAIITLIQQASAQQLHQLQQAIDRRRQQISDGPVSTVVKRRSYRNGILQLESRAYRRKDGGLTTRGPYWYFHYREGGQQKTLYLGKTDDPEGKVAEKLGKE